MSSTDHGTKKVNELSFESAQMSLEQSLNLHLTEEQSVWLNERVSSLCDIETERFLSVINESLHAVRRKLSKRHVVISFSERAEASTPSPYGAVPVGHWLQSELAQIFMISRVLTRRTSLSDRLSTLYKIYDASDTEGRVACLRSLNFVEGRTEDALIMIHDAGRTYLSELMEAGWCHHPFSSKHLSAEELRKAVMKALFCDVSIEGIIGIDQLADQELSRRLSEFANEREAADRMVPPEVWRVASYYPVPGLIARLIGKLEHPMRDDRLNASVCLGRAKDPLAHPFLRDRLSREDDLEVKKAIQGALQVLASQD